MKVQSLRMVQQAPWVLGVMLWMLIVLLVSGCEWYGPKTRDWEEEVLLDDGSTIRIKRHVEFVDNNSLSGDAYSAVETSATLEFPKKMNLPAWSAPLRPLLVYRDEGQWVIVSASTSCEVWRRRGRPSPPYWEYRLTDGAWSEVPLSRHSVGRVPNLFFSYYKRPLVLITPKSTQAQLQVFGLSDKYTKINSDPKDFHCN